MSVKIASFELENVKRVSLVQMSPAENGLTIIGGDNAQGKTSILDGIIYALGGEKYRPSDLQRKGGVADARIKVELTNGLVVERKGKNAALKVSDPTGKRSGQKLLDELIEELALNLPKFIAAKDAEKALILLRILGIGPQLEIIDREENKALEERLTVGRIADQKEKYAKEMPEHHDVPEEMISAAELIQKSGEILKRNEDRSRKRREKADLAAQYKNARSEMERLRKQLAEAEAKANDIFAALNYANAAPVSEDETTAELESQIQNIEIINSKIRENQNKAVALDEAAEYRAKYNRLTGEIEAIRQKRLALLNGAEMPLDGLSIGKDEKGNPILTYNGQAWDCMSTMERYRVAVAIVRCLKPSCGFVLLDGLESFDLTQLREFGEWLTAEGLQAIATRVSCGEECSIIIEDGMVAGTEPMPELHTKEKEKEEMEEW